MTEPTSGMMLMQSMVAIFITIMGMKMMIGANTIRLAHMPPELKWVSCQVHIGGAEADAGNTSSSEIPYRFSNLTMSIQLHDTEILHGRRENIRVRSRYFTKYICA